jgi:DNA-binding XRE family transcriptional regulator
MKYARMNAAISIAKISNDLKINPSTIVSIEDGKHQTSFCIIYSILAYLKIDSKLLFDELEIALKGKR